MAYDPSTGVMYTVVCKQGLLGASIRLHGIEPAIAELHTDVELPFAKFSGSFGEGAYGIGLDPGTAAVPASTVLAVGPAPSKQQPDPLHVLVRVDVR